MLPTNLPGASAPPLNLFTFSPNHVSLLQVLSAGVLFESGSRVVLSLSVRVCALPMPVFLASRDVSCCPYLVDEKTKEWEKSLIHPC